MKRFLDKICKCSGVFGYNGKYPTECWTWTASKNPDGYGMFWIKEKDDNVGAHRFSYEFFIGTIPDDLTLDHLCRVRHCVNPEHLEPVKIKVNILRGLGPAAINAVKSHCINNHEFTKDNTYFQPNGRGCLICLHQYQKNYQRQLRRKLGINGRNDLWTEDEIQLLKQLYPCSSRLHITGKINKSWRAIQHKASYLCVRRPRGVKS